jgi:tRNA pseudouridine55 synthase
VSPLETHGVLVVDKPRGPTSHDVVARLRRALGTRRVGHAGTLDPMASGVLVVLAGEATKLAPYLTASDKRYEARVVLGMGTDTLDADGEVTDARPIPGWLEVELSRLADRRAPEDDALAALAPGVAAALAAERAREAQAPPAHSAIKVQGRRSYALARAGQGVDLSPRPVRVRALRLVQVLAEPELMRALPPSRSAGSLPPAEAGSYPTLDLELEVSKGYYVRALARDLGARLGVPAHIADLRRTASGAFTLARAISPDAGPEALRRALVPLGQAAALALPAARLTEAGARRAHLGQPLRLEDFTAPPPRAGADEEAISAWLAPNGRLVAVGRVQPGPGGEPIGTVVRGFSWQEDDRPSDKR